MPDGDAAPAAAGDTAPSKHPSAPAPGEPAIPIADLSLLGTPREPELLRTMHRALFDVGFFLVAGSPVTEEIAAEAIQQARFFFSLPEEEKAKVDCRLSPHFRGWMPLGEERTMWRPNRRENFDAGFDRPPCTDPEAPLWKRVLQGPNVWPDEKALPDFRPAMERYWDACRATFHAVNALMMRTLGLPEVYMDEHFVRNEPFLFAKLSHYPALGADEQGDEDFVQGLGPHRDAASWITLVVSDGPGLQVQNWSGDWTDVPHIPGTVAVNLAIPFDHFSRGRCPATTHRVNTLLVRGGRISLPYFLSPSFETRVEPLPESVLPAERNPLALNARTDAEPGWTGQDLAGDAERWMLNRTRQYPSVARRFWPELVERFGVPEAD
ncbi:hypothetical protein DFJ74DRAFT_695007 [Hyaloraphidium curvatum]|nr:hypothetical protein DFJ74DRAFT_695007 [Hyaloraphidium curvatum]